MYQIKPIKGFEKDYLIYSDGRVWSNIVNRFLKPALSKRGYWFIAVGSKPRKYFFIHRLIAIHFIPGESKIKREVNHRDGNKLNNSIKNLEWVSSQENNRHAVAMGLIDNFGENSPNAKLKNHQVLKIKQLLSDGVKGRDIAKKFNVSDNYISLIKCGLSWKHIKV